MGSLAAGFNEMLDRIQKRDSELEIHRHHLAELVAKRTFDLEKTNEQLERSNVFSRSILDSMNDSISIINVKDMSIVTVNRVFLNEYGLTEEEFRGKTCHEITHRRADVCKPPDDPCPLLNTVATGGHSSVEHVHSLSGKKIFVEVSTSPIKDAAGEVVQVVHVGRDITTRKLAERKLEQYAADLKQSNEDVLSFAYIVSHDLRAPLVSIKGFAGELQYSLRQIESVLDRCMPHLNEEERTKLAETYRKDVPEAMKFIGSSVSRMDALISAILVLSRLGHRELKPEPLDMTEVSKSILSSLAHQIEQRRTVVTIGELPPITADKLAMEQIMGNLLDNALKYLDPVREGMIAITAGRNGEEIIFHVSDNGRGIAQEDMHKVFELFRRAGEQDVPGEGMGLAYVKTLVRRQGGRIWCESDPGKGTTFSFAVPESAPAHA
jgi:PAS domain S-box-containing protein